MNEKVKYVEKLMKNYGILEILEKSKMLDNKYRQGVNSPPIKYNTFYLLNRKSREKFVNTTIQNIQEKCYKFIKILNELDRFIKKYNNPVKDNLVVIQIKLLADAIRISSDLIRKDINKFVNQVLNNYNDEYIQDNDLAENIQFCQGQDYIIFLEVFKLMEINIGFINKLIDEVYKQSEIFKNEYKMELVIDIDVTEIVYGFQDSLFDISIDMNNIIKFLKIFLFSDKEALLFLNNEW